MRLRHAAAAVAAGIALASGCVDTSSIDWKEPGRPDGGLADGAVVDAAAIEACRKCVTEDGCPEAFAACQNNEDGEIARKCGVYLECSFESYCLNFDLADIAHLPPCVGVCTGKAGIGNQTDPAINVVADVVLCAHDPGRCGAPCGAL